MRKFVDLFEKVPSSILNFLTILSGLYTVVDVIFRILKRLFGLASLDNWFQYCSSDRVISVVKWTFVALLFIKCIIYYRQARSRLISYPKLFHVLTHEYRNLKYSLENGVANHDLLTRDVVRRVSEFASGRLDDLCLLVEDIYGKKIYGCIKLINPPPYPNADIRDCTVSTFVRSKEAMKERGKTERGHVDYIGDNTDFMELVDYNNIRNQFYQPDLLEYSKQLKKDDHEYKNSSPNWKDNYLSTVVVPIQILFADAESGKKVYRVIGFLCLDAKRRNTFTYKLKSQICDLVKAYADLLYTVFELYGKTLTQVTDATYINMCINKENRQGGNN